jgi:MerR family transcriptional regulator, light-induced transcriptional regulator
MAEYKIRDLEILTGIKAHTLRIWEKRYGLVQPDRTDTQIRTYTDQELTTLLNIALLNKNGLKISKIAEMSSEELTNKVCEIKNDPVSDGSTEMLVLALLELDEFLFHKTFDDLTEKHGMVKTFSNYIIPFLDRIGIMWQVGTINPAQEHFMSILIRQKLIVSIDRLPIIEDSKEKVMLFLPEHEWHEIGLLFYNYSLRSRNIKTIYLGQSVPYDSVIECIEKLKPTTLISSWVTSVDPTFMKHYFEDLKRHFPDLKILAGGFQMSEHHTQLSHLVEPISSAADLDIFFPI